MSNDPGPSLETTHHIRDHCLCLHSQRAARALARHFDEAFRPLGLTSGQFSLMMSLNRPDPPTISWVAEFLAMDRTTLTAALKPLERSDFVTVARDTSDGRIKRLQLTDLGRSILKDASEIWCRTHEEIDRMIAGDVDLSLPERLKHLVEAVRQP